MNNVKICGLMPGTDVSFTEHPLVTHVGFVFVPASRRCVSAKQAGELIEDIAGRAKSVGVFVNTPVEEVLRVADESGLHVAQLHGEETVNDCRTLREAGLVVWKTISVPRTAPEPRLIAAMVAEYAPVVDAILLDAAAPKSAGAVSGGHGVPFDWSVLRDIVKLVPSESLPSIWVAGGLDATNVQQLLDGFTPFGVDVSSGVEQDGAKSVSKVHQFLEAVSHPW